MEPFADNESSAKAWGGTDLKVENQEKLLRDFDDLEDRIVGLVDIAAEVAEIINAGADTGEAFGEKVKKFFKELKRIHKELAGYADMVANYRPYRRSIYGNVKDSEIAAAKVELILEQLKTLRTISDSFLETRREKGQTAATPTAQEPMEM